MKPVRILLLCFGLTLLPRPAAASDFKPTDLVLLGAASVAKEACSAVFVSEREMSDYLALASKFWMLPEDRTRIADVKVDRPNRRVTLTMTTGEKGVAVFTGATGCIALGPDGADPKVGFTPLPPVTAKPDVAWPQGDALPQENWPAEVDKAALDHAVDLAFAPDAQTAAYLVLYRGRILAERYGPGITARTRLPGWSITKTVQATLVGALEHDRRLNLFEPAPVAEWSGASDPRRLITLADLLRMSAPIACGPGLVKGWFDHAAWRRDGYVESLYVFSGPDDVYAYSISRPPLAQGETRGAYTNCQPMVVGHIVQQELRKTGETVTGYATAKVFGPLGIRSMVLEPDRVGNFESASYSYAIARDWARLGLLYAQDGVWNGQRMLSPEFMALVRAPAPWWTTPAYGGQVWLSKATCDPWPCDAYWMQGIEGQRVMIVPSRDLVVVRLGHGIGDDPNDPNKPHPAIRAMAAAGKALVAAINRPAPPENRAVETVVQDVFAALGAHDRAAFHTLLAPDFKLDEDGRLMTADQIFDLVAADPVKRRWTITQAQVQHAGDLATVTYRNTGSFGEGAERRVPEWTETAILRRSDDKWRLLSLHSTRIRQIAP
jgi:CubicO group peptidase (beta-lactamase class C family)